MSVFPGRTSTDRLRPEFPPGSPIGARVPADPADMLRDVFLFNKGRIRADLVENLIGRHTFTYGQEILNAWASLQADRTAVRDGDDWVWPIQEAMCRYDA